MLPAAAFLCVLLVFLGFALLVHHGAKHMLDPPSSLAQTEGIRECCFFQMRDISNHETWVVVCWTNALTILLISAAAAC